MTVQTTLKRKDYTANGVTTAFTVPFYFTADTQLRVVVTNTSVTPNVETDAVLGSDYTVTGARNPAGGTVTFLVTPTSGRKVSILRNLDYTQLTHYVPNDPFPAASHEDALDLLTMEVQQIAEKQDRGLQLPVSTTGVSSMLPVPKANKTFGWGADGLSLVEIDPVSPSASALQSSLADPNSVGNGDALIAMKRTLAGAQAINLHDFYEAQIINVKADFKAKGDGVTDDTLAIQNAINATYNAAFASSKVLYFPAGNYKITAPLSIPAQYGSMVGAGQFNTTITFSGVAGGCFTTASMVYLRSKISDMALVGDSSSGKGINLSNLTGQAYNCEIKNLMIISGGECIHAPVFFSSLVENVIGASINAHTFRVSCGPGTVWVNVYAAQTGTGKGGFRLTGNICLIGCNGLNSGDWWGIFGNDTAQSDGYQTDFAANDYPDVTLINCNIEHTASLSTNGGGLLIHAPYRSVTVIGGKLDRSGLTTGYKALVYAHSGSNGGSMPIRMAWGHVFPGTGVASLAKLYCDTGAFFVDENGTLVNAGITTWKNNATTLNYPLLSVQMNGDIYGDNAFVHNALSPRRLSIQMARYAVPAALTPVGTNQTITVTGYNKVIVTPAAAASINKAVFDQTIGAGTDYSRNGDLLIEAGNANLTIVHSASGADTFKMAGGANLGLASGQVVRFARSETGGNWIQV